MSIHSVMSPQLITIRFAGEINMPAAHELMDEISLAHDYYQLRTVELLISGPGGDVEALHYLLDELEPWRNGEQGRVLRTVAYGGVASASALLFSFGTIGHRYAQTSSRLLYHSVRTHFKEGAIQTGSDLRAANRRLETIDNSVLSLLAKHISGGSETEQMSRAKELKRLFRRDKFISPEEARKACLLDHVGRAR